MTTAIVCAAVQSDCRAVALLDSYWLLSCDADPVIADSSLKVSAYFLPPKSILVSDWLPSSLVGNSVALLGSGRLSSSK